MENSLNFAHSCRYFAVKPEDVSLDEIHNLCDAVALFIAPRLKAHIEAQEEEARIDEGLRLFGKYFRDLWI